MAEDVEEDPKPSPVLRVRVEVDDALESDGMHSVHFTLRDTGIADALHPELASIAHEIAAVRDGEVEVPVPADVLHADGRYSLFVHISLGEDGTIESGDFITVENVPVVVDDLLPEADALTVKPKRI